MDDIGIVHGEGFELHVAQVSLNLAFFQILGFGMSSLSLSLLIIMKIFNVIMYQSC
mgnify:CR=1 FL=1